MNDDIILSVEKLRKTYKDVTAVAGVSFDVKKGGVFGLLGPNGAGKTTIIRMLCGILKADSGSITVKGIPMKTGYEKIKPLIGLCPQDIVIWELLTCFEQLKAAGIFYGMTARKAGGRAEELLAAFGLEDKRNKAAKTLSGGMQRRLNIALALVHDPDLVILDEPQAGLDPQSRILVRDFIREISKEKTVILTTHDMDEADRLSDMIAVIDHGKILVIDTPERIKARAGAGDILQIRADTMDIITANKILNAMPPEMTGKKFADGAIYLEAPDLLELIPAVNKAFKDAGASAGDMTIRKRTLEDAFIAMTGRGLRE